MPSNRIDRICRIPCALNTALRKMRVEKIFEAIANAISAVYATILLRNLHRRRISINMEFKFNGAALLFLSGIGMFCTARRP